MGNFGATHPTGAGSRPSWRPAMFPRSLRRPLGSPLFLLLGASPLAGATATLTIHNQTARTLSVSPDPGRSTPAGLRRDPGPACRCLAPGTARPEAPTGACHCLRPGAAVTYSFEGPEEESKELGIWQLPEGGTLHHLGFTIAAVDPVPPCPCPQPAPRATGTHPHNEGLAIRVLEPGGPFAPESLLPGWGEFRPIGDEPPPDPEGSGAAPGSGSVTECRWV